MANVLFAIKEAIFPLNVHEMPIAPPTVDGVILKASVQAVDLYLSTMVPTILLDIKKME